MVERDLRLARADRRPATTSPTSRRPPRSRRSGRPRRAACGSPATRPRHYLALNELEVEGYRTFAKVSPPLRERGGPAAPWSKALRDGTIDAIASDHCPQDQDSKRLPFAQAACGVIGLETMLPVALRLHHEGRHRPARRCCGRMTVGAGRPARARGRPAAQGAPADLVLFDPEAPWKITEEGAAQPVQEHRLRGPPGGGQGGPHPGRRPHDLRPLTAATRAPRRAAAAGRRRSAPALRRRCRRGVPGRAARPARR